MTKAQVLAQITKAQGRWIQAVQRAEKMAMLDRIIALEQDAYSKGATMAEIMMAKGRAKR